MSALRTFSPLRMPSAARRLDVAPPPMGWGDEPVTAVFDLDGTLVDTAPDLAAALDHCLVAAGLAPTTLAAVRPDAGRGAQAMLRAAYGRARRPLGAEELAEQTERFLQRYAAHIADRSRPFPGAEALLDRLGAAGAILAVCTNKTEVLAIQLLRDLGLFDRFAAVCGADTFAARKPDPVHLLGTVHRAGGSAAHAVMIGDSDADIEAARRAGVPSVLVGFGYDATAALRNAATLVVERFDDLDAGCLAALAARPALVAV